MTPEHFCMWLEGFLDGNAGMDLDEAKLREKLATVGAVETKPLPKKDVPLTRSDDDSFRGGMTAGITGGLSGSLIPRGGFVSAIGDSLPPYTLTASKVEPGIFMTNSAVADATLAMTSPTTAMAKRAGA